jgi:VanZ family protein
MPTDRFACLVAAAALALAVLTAGPHHIDAPWDKVLHFVVYAAIAALLWLGTEARAPLAVTAVVIAFGAMDEIRQLFVAGRSADLADFFADAAAAASVAVFFLGLGKRIWAPAPTHASPGMREGG